MTSKKEGGAKPGCVGRNETYRSVIEDLTSVIGLVRNSLRLIESEIARDTVSEEDAADDFVVLDDVTPGYARACAALRECDAGLSIALHLLRESMMCGDRRLELDTESILPSHRHPSA